MQFCYLSTVDFKKNTVNVLMITLRCVRVSIFAVEKQ